MQSFLYFLFIGIRFAFDAFTWLIIIYTLLSWIPNAYNTKFAALLNRIVGPYLGVFDRIIPPIMGISFSPIVAIIALQFVERGLLMFVNIFI
ncbi:YggT family protein [Agrilactobacillus yilanensis]|uniref:YggT family protein n=1 Tax=Agrilactobacillus yilanensis TaxID=2485997 RepID=A0ABW4J428_9LACO|nr:YggT family protein [Agrilactobacillus yilanensis]